MDESIYLIAPVSARSFLLILDVNNLLIEFIFYFIILLHKIALRIVRNLRSKLYGSMIRQEVGWFDQKGTGELINRLSTDAYLVGNSLSQNLSDGLRSSVMILAGTGMMVCFLLNN